MVLLWVRAALAYSLVVVRQVCSEAWPGFLVESRQSFWGLLEFALGFVLWGFVLVFEVALLALLAPAVLTKLWGSLELFVLVWLGVLMLELAEPEPGPVH